MFINIFHCSYNPYDGPNEHPEAELPLVAGKYLYVYGTMDEDGFYEGLTCFLIVQTISLSQNENSKVIISRTLPHAGQWKSWGKFCSSQNFSGASQQNSLIAFS